MSAEPGPRRSYPWWAIAIGAVVVVAIGAAVAVALTGGGPAGQSTTPSPVPSTPSGSATPTPTSSATPTPSPSATPTPSPTPTPTPTATPSAKDADAYCKAMQAILNSNTADTEPDEEGGVDYKRLSATYADLIKKYSAAAKYAPDSLREQFDAVLGYLKQAKRAVDSKDLNQIKEMVRSLSTLNDTMDAIQKTSRQICG